ncbi:transcriptional regulator/sugar kinase [Opitutaceae bacterium TAV1]|nr:transcriptional regulator/sugar kinase [Opitutaceae bacterium TAV1]
MLSSLHPCILAIDAGGTFFKSALVAPDGEILVGTQHTVPVDSQGPASGILAAWVSVFKAAFAAAAASTPARRIAAIGVSTPGPFDYARHTSLMTHKFQAIRGLDLRRALGELYPEIGDIPLRFIHDAHAFIIGEHGRGAACGHERVIGVTLGTGVGFGCIIDGAIRDNGSGGPLVSLFRKPYRDGLLEDYVSRRGIIRLYREHAGQGAPPGLDVAEIASLAITRQDPAARAAFDDAGRALGETLRPVVDELSATCLVAGGQIARAFPLFGPALCDALAGCGSLRLVTVAWHIDTAGLYGAAMAAAG